jgi:hypothetical protein
VEPTRSVVTRWRHDPYAANVLDFGTQSFKVHAPVGCRHSALVAAAAAIAVARINVWFPQWNVRLAPKSTRGYVPHKSDRYSCRLHLECAKLLHSGEALDAADVIDALRQLMSGAGRDGAAAAHEGEALYFVPSELAPELAWFIEGRGVVVGTPPIDPCQPVGAWCHWDAAVEDSWMRERRAMVLESRSTDCDWVLLRVSPRAMRDAFAGGAITQQISLLRHQYGYADFVPEHAFTVEKAVRNTQKQNHRRLLQRQAAAQAAASPSAHPGADSSSF